MKVSSKGEYACLAMLDLAEAYSRKELVSLKTITRRHHIPENYLVQIMLQLQSSGLVASRRGPQGGYYLLEAPEKISLGRVIRAIEGPIAVSKCLELRAFGEDRAQTACVFRDIWASVQEKIAEIIDSVSFAEILQRQRGLEENHAKIKKT